MSFFSSDAFLTAAQRAYFPQGDVRPGDVNVAGQTYRVLVDKAGRPQSAYPFLDVLEPTAHNPSAPSAPWLRPVDTGRLSVADYKTQAEAASADEGAAPMVGPFVEWSAFDGFDAFFAASKKNSSRAFRQLRKGRRTLEKNVGQEVVFRFHDDTPAHFETCLRWKSAQYVASGFEDLMQSGGATLFRELSAAGALVVSTLTAGDRLVAAHLGAHHDGVFYYWIPAYDGELHKYSPGSLLLEELLQHSCAHGDKRFDFLVGAEPYKFFYATDVRRIGQVGTLPVSRRLLKRARASASRRLKRYPNVYAFLKAQKTRIKKRLG